MPVDAIEPGDADNDDAVPSHMVALRANVKNLGPNEFALSENVAETNNGLLMSTSGMTECGNTHSGPP